MKKLTLMTMAATFALIPALANADYKNNHSLKTYNKVEVNKNYNRANMRSDGADIVLDVDNTESAYVTKSKGQTLSFALEDGERLQIKNKVVYLVDTDGTKAFAPNGAYTAPNGITYIAENGLLLRTEAPDQTAYIYTDEGVDVEMKTQRNSQR